jgi:formate/nitrite transporter FocA (FNT family)
MQAWDIYSGHANYTADNRYSLLTPMSSEDSSTTLDEPKSYDEILSQEVDEGLREFERSSASLFLSALSAGLDLGFSALIVAAVITLVTGVYGTPLTTLLVANAYTIGFIFVVLGRSELFTEHTSLAVLPVLVGSDL